MSNTGELATEAPLSIPPSTSLPSDTNAGGDTPTKTVLVARDGLGISSWCPNIKKLNGDNWFAWKFRITTVLEWKDAYEVVAGTIEQPQDPAAAAEWKTKDIFARWLISTSIDDEQIIHTLGCDTSAQMWEALRVIHEPRDMWSVVSTKRALYSAQAGEDTDIPSHLNYMQLLREKLTSIGHPIDDAEFNFVLIASLPRSWDAFTAPYYFGYQPAQTTVLQLIARLREQYIRRQEEESDELAHPTKTGTSTTKRQYSLCGICGHNSRVNGQCGHMGKDKRAMYAGLGNYHSAFRENSRKKGRVGKGKVRANLA